MTRSGFLFHSLFVLFSDKEVPVDIHFDEDTLKATLTHPINIIGVPISFEIPDDIEDIPEGSRLPSPDPPLPAPLSCSSPLHSHILIFR